MSNWVEMDEQWRQRSEELFKRCLREPDVAKAQRAWSAACEAEAKRLEWKSLCLQHEKEFRATTVDNERSRGIPLGLSLFTPCTSHKENQFPQSLDSTY